MMADDKRQTTNVEEQPTTNVEKQPTTNVEEQPTTNVEEQTTSVEEQTTNVEDQPTTNVEKQPTTNVEEQTTNVEKQPTTNVEEQTTNDEKQPITDAEKQPTPNVEEQQTTNVEEQPTTIVEEPTTNVEEQPASNVEEQQTTDVEEEPTTNVEEQTTNVENPSSTDVEKQPSTNNEKESSSDVEKRPTTNVKKQPTNVVKRPTTNIKRQITTNVRKQPMPIVVDEPMKKVKKPLVKVLVCSGIAGRIKLFVACVERLCVKKGLFDYVFCIGDFFGDESNEKEWEEYKKLDKSVSVPVYTLGPNKPEHVKYFENLKDQQLAPNIFYLGKDGVFKTSDGLKVGYISGIQHNKSKKTDIHSFNYDSIVNFKESCVRSGITSLDLLLTSPWPVDIRNKERIPENQVVEEKSVNKEHESKLLSWVAVNLTPRYFFSSLQNVYFERTPHKNNNSNTITRFLGLANFLNKETRKSLYGFVMLPILPKTRTKIDYTVTESPYDDQSKYIADLIPKRLQYFFNTSTDSNGPPNKKKRLSQNINQSIDINNESCWFCLSSKNIAKHMIISIGDEAYLAGTKGPLVKEHVLISPIEHYKSFAEVPTETLTEINLIKSSLNQYFESTDRGAVYFERTILSAHCQLQVVPVPNTIIDQVEELFKKTFKDHGLILIDIPPAASLRQIASFGDGNYFYVELPNGKRMFHSAKKKNETQKEKFPLHIAREVLASPKLLNVEDRIDWKKCAQSEGEETSDVKSFRSAFRPYNPIED